MRIHSKFNQPLNRKQGAGNREQEVTDTQANFRAKPQEDPLTGDIDMIGISDPDGFEDDETLPGWDIEVTDYLSSANPRAAYEYDFGDSWEHTVLLEGVLAREKGAKYPVCIDGARACPPEDCGGPPGYQELLHALFDVTHEEHESMRTWAGEQFDPALFEKDAIRFDDPEKRWKMAFERNDEAQREDAMRSVHAEPRRRIVRR